MERGLLEASGRPGSYERSTRSHFQPGIGMRSLTTQAATLLIQRNPVWGWSQHVHGGEKTLWISWGTPLNPTLSPLKPTISYTLERSLSFKPVCKGIFCYLLPKILIQFPSISFWIHTRKPDLENSLFFTLILKNFNLMKKNTPKINFH